jgi:hypothetical protein
MPMHATLPLSTDFPVKAVRVRSATNSVLLKDLQGIAEVRTPIEPCKRCIGRHFVARGAAIPSGMDENQVMRAENLPPTRRIIRATDGIADVNRDPNRLTILVDEDDHGVGMTSHNDKHRTVHRLLPVFVALAAAWTYWPPPAQAASPAAVCARAGTDDTLRPIPDSLVPAVNTVFGTAMPARMAMDTTVFRCSGGRAGLHDGRQPAVWQRRTPATGRVPERSPGVAIIRMPRSFPPSRPGTTPSSPGGAGLTCRRRVGRCWRSIRAVSSPPIGR